MDTLERDVLMNGTSQVFNDNDKQKGGEGQPCRVPFEMSNGSEEVPFTNTAAEGWEYRDITLEIKYVPRPSCSSESRRNLQLTLSNAFSASKDRRQAFRF